MFMRLTIYRHLAVTSTAWSGNEPSPFPGGTEQKITTKTKQNQTKKQQKVRKKNKKKIPKRKIGLNCVYKIHRMDDGLPLHVQ